MGTKQSSSDLHQSTIVRRSPGLAYERMREARRSHFSQSLVRKLTVQASLLFVVATALVLLLAHDSGAPDAARDLGVLAASAGSLLVLSAAVHVGVGIYRLRREPLTEREALRLLAVEDGASYLGLGTGGLLVASTVVLGAVDLIAGTPIGGQGTSIAGTFAAVTATAAILSLAAGQYLDAHLPEHR